MDNAIKPAGFFLAPGEYFDAIFSNKQRVFKLGGGLLVLSSSGPAVFGTDLALPGSGIDHRLNGEYHARGEQHMKIVLIMQYLGILVKALADAVAAEIPDDGEGGFIYGDQV